MRDVEDEERRRKGDRHLPKHMPETRRFYVFLLRRILKIRWQESAANRKYCSGQMWRRLSDDIRRRRWMFSGQMMRKGQDNGCGVELIWTPEGQRKRGRPKTTWWRTPETDGARAGWKSWNEVRPAANLTGTVGESMRRPYVLRGTKRIGEGEVEGKGIRIGKARKTGACS